MTEASKSANVWPELEAETVTLTAEQKKELGRKNLAVGGALFVFVALIFFVTMAKLATNFGA